MEYLMTYGWAILIVIIVAAVLFSLGVFDPGAYTTTSAVGFPGFNVPVNSYAVQSSNDNITWKLTNGVGATVNVTAISLTLGPHEDTDCFTQIGKRALMKPGETITIICDINGDIATASSITAGTSYSARIELTYDNIDGGWTGIQSAGTLVGQVL